MAFYPPLQALKVPVLTVRQRWLGILRILFGVVWAVAASLKWQPAFIKGFADIVQGAMDGQPQPVKLWIAFWLSIIHLNPSLFAYTVAITETALALCFMLGAFTNLACRLGRFSFLASHPLVGINEESRIAQAVKEREVARKF